MFRKPHIRRDSLWDYLSVATSEIYHFGQADDDIDDTVALVMVAHLPQLLMCIIYDIRTPEELDKFLKENQQAVASAHAKFHSSIKIGALEIYDPKTMLSVGETGQKVCKDEYLVRIDDITRWCSSEGIEISPSTSRRIAKRPAPGVKADEVKGPEVTEAKDEKTFSKRERNNLLRIIKALAAAQKLDIKQPYKAAEIILKEVHALGHSISEATVVAKLKEAEKLEP